MSLMLLKSDSSYLTFEFLCVMFREEASLSNLLKNLKSRKAVVCVSCFIVSWEKNLKQQFFCFLIPPSDIGIYFTC